MATIFFWDPNRYEMNIPEMDQEHQKIISQMNEIFQENSQNHDKQKLLQLLDSLVKTVSLHFEHEESYMEGIKYPGLNNHRNIHQRLLAQLKHYQNEFENNSSNVLSLKFFDFLILWLSAHIQHIDMQYSPKRFNKSA